MGRVLVGVVMLSLVLTLAPAVGGQEAPFKVPDGWLASPENDKQPGDAGYRILHHDSGVEMVFVPGGKFVMGWNEGEGAHQPAHEVELSPYWIGRTEVTVGQWRKMMAAVPRL